MIFSDQQDVVQVKLHLLAEEAKLSFTSVTQWVCLLREFQLWSSLVLD